MTDTVDAQLHCSNCHAVCSKWDSYCGMCGADRVELKGGLVRDGSNSIVIFLSEDNLQDDAFEVILSSRNHNALYARLLQPEDIPSWVVAASVAPHVSQHFLIGGRNEHRIRLSCNPVALSTLKERFKSGVWEMREIGIELRFLLASGRPLSGHRWAHRELIINIQLDLGVDSSPRGSVYPLLPLTPNQGSICMHTIEFTNYSQNRVRIRCTRIQDCATDIEALGYPFLSNFQVLTGEAERINSLEVLDMPEPKQLLLNPLEQKALRVGIRTPVSEFRSVSNLPRWFAAELVFQLTFSNQQSQQRYIQVAGTIAEPPNLKWTESRHSPNMSNAQAPHQIFITSREAIFSRYLSVYVSNTGALPVTILHVESFWVHASEISEPVLHLGPERQVRPHEDWLSWRDDGLRDIVIPPRTLEYDIRFDVEPSRRQQHENSQKEGYRCIRVHHNGAGKSPLELRLCVELGERKQLSDHTLLIDFGTSNSVVAVLDRRQNSIQQLDIEPARPKFNQKPKPLMPSLMFFLPVQRSGQDFLYGRVVHTSRRSDYGNVIRSLKGVMENSEEQYLFQYFNDLLGQECQSQFQLQDILNLFVQELKVRAEQAYAKLRASEDGISYGVIEEAIFTHPVDLSSNAANALFVAQAKAGLNPDISDVDAFLERRCIDESTASLITVLFDEEGSQATEVIQEAVMNSETGFKIICIDIGGGTTDIVCAQVSIPEDINIQILSRDGARFGGDHIDRLIAHRIIEEMFHLEPHRLERQIFEDAIQCTTIQGFLHRSIASVGRSIGQDVLEQIWLESIIMLTKAEVLKRQIDYDGDLLYSMLPDEAIFSSQHENIITSPVNLSTAVLCDDITTELIKTVHPVILRALAGASWKAEDVDALIFTGQTTRMPLIREGCQALLTGVPLVISAATDQYAFEPKQCVARGAGYFDINRASLRLEQVVNETLNYSLQRRAGFRYRDVEGLSQGTRFTDQASGVVTMKNPTDRFMLYRSIDVGKKPPAVIFDFESPVVGEVKIELYGPNDIRACVAGRTINGKIMLEGGSL